MRHDRDAENEGLKNRLYGDRSGLARSATAGQFAARAAGTDPAAVPETGSPQGDFLSTFPPPCFSGAARTTATFRQLRPPAVIGEPLMTDGAEPCSLAERLACYVASPALQDQPLMRRDLLEASEQISDFRALLRAWRAAFEHLEGQTGQEFAEWLGTKGMTDV
jgi:hypothetical protein